ncbi:hypothetical protein ATANTOWER_022038 [Ataeniobius toweri]|uniref:Secreted protein n=1 Tax=Ataeniobius toweri TaxID=208326 RepID=A0ABU7A237_9TELE|nr:hypothetical protein [Ataeniobius toweri]
MGPLALSDLCLAAASGSCGLVAANPWGFCTVAAGWFPRGCPLLFSQGVAVVPVVVLLGFPCSWEPLDVCGSDLLRMCVSDQGEQVCGSLHSLLHIFMEKPYIHKRDHTYPPDV